MSDNPAVDSADTDLAVDAEAQNEISSEDLATQIQQLKELNEHLSEQIQFQKTEAKKAFEKRDKINDELKTIKSDTSKDDLLKYVETLEAKLTEKDSRLSQIEQQQIRQTKLDAVLKIAKEQGLKDQYLNNLDKFIELEDVDPEKRITVKMAVDSVKTSFPDLFSTNSAAVDRALPNPKLSATGGDYKAQYEALLATPPGKREPDHMVKLDALRRKAFPDQY